MPEAAIDEDDGATSGKDQIGSKAADPTAEPIAQTQRVKRATQTHLRTGVSNASTAQMSTRLG
jgi:hypothetical protein